MDQHDRYHRAARDGFLGILYDASKREANQSDDDGLTPTLLAAFSGHLDALRILVGRGGDPEKTTILGSSALHLASSKGYLNCVSFLVNFGVNLWCLDNDLRTPKDIASMNMKKEVVDYLEDTMAKQSALNTKTVQRYKEKAVIAAEKRIKSFRKLQLKAIKQAEKEERNTKLLKRKLFSSTSDINLVGTSIKNHNSSSSSGSSRNLYQFSDQFGDNLYLKSAKSLLKEENVGPKKGSRRYSGTSLSSRDDNSNVMKFSEIVNNISDQTNSSYSTESTITSKIRSIGAVSRKVHLKKLMQTISSTTENQSSLSPLNEYRSRQGDDSGNCSIGSLNGFKPNDQILYAPKYDTRSLNVTTKRQPVSSVFRSVLPDDIDSHDCNGDNGNSISSVAIDSLTEETRKKISSKSSAHHDEQYGSIDLSSRYQLNTRTEKSISKAISVPDFTLEAGLQKVQQLDYGEYIVNSSDDRQQRDENHSPGNSTGNIRLGQDIESLNVDFVIASPKSESPFNDNHLEVKQKECLNGKKSSCKLPSVESFQKQHGNFETLDDSIGSAGSLAQRNTASTASSPSTTKSSSSDQTFESISVLTNESSSIYDNNLNPIVVDKSNLLLSKLDYLRIDGQLPNGVQQQNGHDFDKDAIDMFLMTNGLIDLREVFSSEKIDLEAMMLLTEDDLKSLNILLGPRRKLLKAIQERSNQLHDPHIMMDTPL